MKFREANKLIVKGLLDLGAKEVTDPHFKVFTIQTKYGELRVSPSTPHSCRGRQSTMSCTSRFEDVELAKYHTNCNPYSGKWNWVVWSIDYTATTFAERVINDIKKILPSKQEDASKISKQ